MVPICDHFQLNISVCPLVLFKDYFSGSKLIETAAFCHLNSCSLVISWNHFPVPDSVTVASSSMEIIRWITWISSICCCEMFLQLRMLVKISIALSAKGIAYSMAQEWGIQHAITGELCWYFSVRKLYGCLGIRKFNFFIIKGAETSKMFSPKLKGHFQCSLLTTCPLPAVFCWWSLQGRDVKGSVNSYFEWNQKVTSCLEASKARKAAQNKGLGGFFFLLFEKREMCGKAL